MSTLISRKTTPELQREIEAHRPVCPRCQPKQISLNATMCGCVAFTYMHKCRPVLVEVRLLCDGCCEDMEGAA